MITEEDVMRVAKALDITMRGYFEQAIRAAVYEQVRDFLATEVRSAVADAVKRLLEPGLTVTVEYNPPQEK